MRAYNMQESKIIQTEVLASHFSLTFWGLIKHYLTFNIYLLNVFAEFDNVEKSDALLTI